MNKGFLHILKHSVLHVCFWFAVWFFFKAFFSVGSNNAQFIFWFSIILSFVSITASYIFIYNLLPNYLLRKKYKEFALYTIYAGVFITFGVFVTMAFGFIFYFFCTYE